MAVGNDFFMVTLFTLLGKNDDDIYYKRKKYLDQSQLILT